MANSRKNRNCEVLLVEGTFMCHPDHATTRD
jgi:hypothetical protein